MAEKNKKSAEKTKYSVKLTEEQKKELLKQRMDKVVEGEFIKK